MTSRPCVNKECPYNREIIKDRDIECLLFFGVRENEEQYCKKYIPEPEKLKEPQEIAVEIDWHNNQYMPHHWQVRERIPAGYSFKCFEFALPDGNKRYSMVPMLFCKEYPIENGMAYSLSIMEAEIKKLKTIRASKIIFCREGD